MTDMLTKPLSICQSVLQGTSKRTSGNSLSLLGAQNKDIGAASQTLLIEVKLRLEADNLLSSMAFWYYVSD